MGRYRELLRDAKVWTRPAFVLPFTLVSAKLPHKLLNSQDLWGKIGDMEATNIIKETLVEELERNERSQRVYRREIDLLPRGSVCVRSRGGRQYCYLKYREGDKTVTKYVGAAPLFERELREKVDRRKTLEESLRRLKREQAFIEKALRHA